MAASAGHEVRAPRSSELDLFDPAAVAAAVADVDAILHLATRIQPFDKLDEPDAWHENDRLRAEASRILVDAGLAASVQTYVQPTVTFVYPRDHPADESTPLADPPMPILRSALAAEAETKRFADAGRRGVVLRFGLLDGPGTGRDEPMTALGATSHVDDAGAALLLALKAPSGIYNACRDGERVANRLFSETTGWRPRH
jgi:nucleoside-diphosphate-sugar epimerase